MTAAGKLAIGGLVIVAATVYMAYVGASSSFQYYLTVDECARDAAMLYEVPIRVNGRVVAESLQIDRRTSKCAFELQGTEQRLPVICTGPIPDNLVEEREVVVEGRLARSGTIVARKVLTKCASKYEAAPGPSMQ